MALDEPEEEITARLEGPPGEASADASSGPVRGLAGRQIGPYRLIREIGHGGQGYVYLAEAEHPRRFVALKILTEMATLSPLSRLRFDREAEATARLSHPGICTIYERGESEGIPYIAMQYVEGETLDRRIKSSREQRTVTANGPSSPDFVDIESDTTAGAAAASRSGAAPEGRQIDVILRFFQQAAQTLHFAHEAGLVHRDIKPGNIMRAKAGEPVILDFGLAHDARADGMTLTHTGDFMGTPAYMAPEQLASQRITTDRRADIYSLGVTLFECLTLERPFRADSREALYRQISFKEAPDPRRQNPAISRDLSVIILKALQKDPDRRFQTAEELAEDLRRLLSNEPILARPIGPLVRQYLWCRRNPGWAAALYGFILMAAVTAGVFIWKNAELRGANRSLESKSKEAQDNANRAEANATRADANAARAEAKTQEALANAAAATAREQEVQEKLAEVRRMADIKLAQELESEVDRLWPLGSALPARIEAWQARLRPLVDRLPLHEAALQKIEAQALPYTTEDRTADHGPALARLEALRAEEDALEKELDGSPAAERESAIEHRLDDLGAERETLEGEVAIRLTWRFAGEDSDYLSWQRRNFAELIEALGRFTKAETGHLARVESRLSPSRLLVEKSLREAALLWESCRGRLKSNPKYRDLDLSPQEGLIPLGPDPDSGFEEFLHWASHDPGHPIPTRDASGHLPAMDAETGVILVLLPGGRFLMGAQNSDPQGPNFDSQAFRDESPVHPVVLSPFFLGKHELTRGQWTRLSGAADPSYWIEENSVGLVKKSAYGRHPVEQVSWFDSVRELWRGGLQLPTESQCEYGCRAGSDKPWSFGSDLKSFPSFSNLADESYGRGFRSIAGAFEKGLDDQQVLTAPVGSYRANAFGLLDMHGNVWEWTQDEFGPYGTTEVQGDKAASGSGSGLRVERGGSFDLTAFHARSASRLRNAPSIALLNLGARPARGISP